MVLAFRVVTLGTKGWFWWRHLTVQGIRSAGPADIEAFLDPEDYFAPIS